jgi:hypothetical protein
MPFPTERDNRMMWDGDPGHYEVWYLTLAHRPSQTGFWIRHLLEAPLPGERQPYAELWFARFDGTNETDTFGIHQRFPVPSLRAGSSPFTVQLGEARLTGEGASGSVEGAGHAARWSLRWRPSATTHFHYPAFLYKSGTATKICSPNPGVAVEGEMEVDGRRYEFAGEPGEQSHVWGRKHAYQWAWSHCNGFDGYGPDVERGAVFISTSGRLKRGSVILPKLTGFTLYLDGEEHAFRQPWKIPLARSDYSSTHYRLIGVSPETRVEARFTCRPEDMVLCEYLDPDGDPAFCHYTGAADGEILVKRRSPFGGRFRDHKRLLARRTVHFEWGGRAGDVVRVKKTHVLV